MRILYYNTGQGVENHPASKKKNTYQTFIEYAEVPIGNLQDPKIWTTFIARELSDMPAAYALLENLCTGGMKQPASQHEEFYEAIQKSASCAYQCILAMIRERLVSSFPNPAEGLALYKIVKGIMLNAFKEMTQDKLHETINTQLQSKLRVVGTELSIARALVEPIERDKLVIEICAELRAHKAKDLKGLLEALAEQMEHSDKASSLVLFTLVRKAIDALTSLDTPLTQNGLAHEAIMARREKENLNKQEYKKNLDSFLEDLSPERIEEWRKTFATQYQGGTLQNTALEWAIARLNQIPKGKDDSDPGAVLLNDLVEGVRSFFKEVPQREAFLSLLISRFQQSGNPKMAAYLQAECRKAEKKENISGFQY